MDKPDPPAEAMKLPPVGAIDPAIAAQVTLLEAEYLKAQAAALTSWAAPVGGTGRDLSPLGH